CSSDLLASPAPPPPSPHRLNRLHHWVCPRHTPGYASHLALLPYAVATHLRGVINQFQTTHPPLTARRLKRQVSVAQLVPPTAPHALSPRHAMTLNFPTKPVVLASLA